MNCLVGKNGNLMATMPNDLQNTGVQSCLELGHLSPGHGYFLSPPLLINYQDPENPGSWNLLSALPFELACFKTTKTSGHLPNLWWGMHRRKCSSLPTWDFLWAFPQLSCLDLSENFMDWKSVSVSIYPIAIRWLYNLTIPNCSQLKLGPCVDNPRCNF